MTARAVASLWSWLEWPPSAAGGVLVAWSASRYAGSSTTRRGRWRRCGRDRSGSCRAASPGLEGHRLVIVPRGGGSTPASRATRRSVADGPSDRAAAPSGSLAPPLRYPPSDARRRPLRHPREPGGTRRRSSPRCRPWTRCGLGDVVGYGPHPDEVVARLRELGAIGVRGNHDAAALGGREIESFNVDARSGRWSGRARRSRTTRRPGWPPAGDPRARGRPAGPRQPARSDLGVRDLDAGGPRGDGRDGDPRRPARPHAPARSPTSRTTDGWRP